MVENTEINKLQKDCQEPVRDRKFEFIHIDKCNFEPDLKQIIVDKVDQVFKYKTFWVTRQ